MAFIDKKERIISISLTEKGREALSKNQFSVKYYAFSDDGVDYSGSLYATNPNNGISSEKLEEYIVRTFLPFECENLGGDSIAGVPTRDFKSFLFTVEDNQAVPDFKFAEEITEITLSKFYETKQLSDFIKQDLNSNKNIEFIINATSGKDTSTEQRALDYAEQQRITNALNRIG